MQQFHIRLKTALTTLRLSLKTPRPPVDEVQSIKHLIIIFYSIPNIAYVSFDLAFVSWIDYKI